MKTIKMYAGTSFALEVMRTAIEIQLEKQIRFLGEYDTFSWSRSHKDEGKKWESCEQSFKGKIVTNDGEVYPVYARIEYSSFTGVWRSDRVFFELFGDCLTRYVAISQYRHGPRDTYGVDYPDFMNSTSEDFPLSSNEKWRVGKSFLDVRPFNGGDWHRVMNTYIHP